MSAKQDRKIRRAVKKESDGIFTTLCETINGYSLRRRLAIAWKIARGKF